MVKIKSNGKREAKQGRKEKSKGEPARIVKITAETSYGECSERLTAFGGLLALVKFLDLMEFEAMFERHYKAPSRKPELGNYRMVFELLMLLFIGFQRLGQFVYVCTDAMRGGIMDVTVLPVVSTFWRYLRSLTIVQSESILRLNGTLREKVWEK